MPVITLSSPKGGAGKTTAATILATELAERGVAVTVIDADPNKNVVDWSTLPGKPETLTVVGDVTEETIVDAIEEAASNAAFVIVDLEGTASLMVSYAISMSDFVIIPVQGSQLDAKQAARQMKLIKAQERIANRSIPFAVLFTRSNPAIQPKTQRHIEERFGDWACRFSRRGFTIVRPSARSSLSADRCHRLAKRALAISRPPKPMRSNSPRKLSPGSAATRPPRRRLHDERS
jgi:chromosome partitioning protein